MSHLALFVELDPSYVLSSSCSGSAGSASLIIPEEHCFILTWWDSDSVFRYVGPAIIVFSLNLLYGDHTNNGLSRGWNSDPHLKPKPFPNMWTGLNAD